MARRWTACLVFALLGACTSSGSDSPIPQAADFQVTAVTPPNNAQSVGLGTEINIVFSRPVDITTLGPTTVQVVAESGDHIRGIRRIGNFNKGIVRFLPDPSYIPFAVHSIRVFDELRDTSGRPLDRDYEFRFETVPASPVLLVQTQIEDL